MKELSPAGANPEGRGIVERALHRVRGAPGRKGVVLIAVLWCCAIVMWAGFQLSAQTRLLGEDELHSIAETHALYLAIGGCYEALARIHPGRPLQAQSLEQNWLPDGKPRVVVYHTGIAVVIMESDDRKINVNSASADQLTVVLKKAGADAGTAQMLAERITDFIHPGNASQLQGQPQANTSSANGGKSDTGFQGPLTSLDQLLLVPGITQELFYGYAQGVKEWGSRSGILDHIAIPAKNSLFSQLSVNSGNANAQQGLSGLQTLQGGQEPAFLQNSWAAGGTYRILSFGKSAKGPPSVGIRLTIRLGQGGNTPYRILSRKIL
ncbi:MAG: hypothetical protein ACP5SH_01745 [Syntrophobacteraceae bacterium]